MIGIHHTVVDNPDNLKLWLRRLAVGERFDRTANDDLEARHHLAELTRKNQKSAKPMVEFPPFIEKDGKSYHGMTRLIADIKKNRGIPDFRGAGWRTW